MPLDLKSLVHPSSTAVITVECQKGVIGSTGPLSALSQAVRESGMVARAAELLRAARAARVPVMHGIVVRRADGGGSTVNCRLFAATRKAGGPGLLAGSEAARVVDEFAVADSDYLVPRHHGVSLFHDTELDSLLRSLGVRTVVLAGVSINIALLGTTIEAVNRGYQVVIPEDAVTGTPPEYVKMVLTHTLPLLATVTRTDEIRAAW
ncbi:MAG TPA: cysteine hydrolase [Candidatus Bathyarchaeia archaeon]|nr:cysteine hydrolase [Candidatus Bathyarchaeia archaeon]